MTDMVSVLVNGRWPLLVPEHRAARPEWATGWERERLDAMAERIHPGDVVLDIGVEEGDLTALYAMWGARVVLVEPNPKAWPNVRAIFDANNLTDAVIGRWVGFAGSASRHSPTWIAEHVIRDTSDPWTEDIWPACAFGELIGDHGFLMPADHPEVPVATIDDLADRFGPPDVITIDVEGAEVDVLNGAAGTLTACHPTVFVSVHINLPGIDEVHPDDLRDQVTHLMAVYGYEGRLLAVDHEEHWQFDPVAVRP